MPWFPLRGDTVVTTKFGFESGYRFSVPLDANVSVEVVVMRKYNTIRNFLKCQVVLTSLKASLVSTTVSTLKSRQVYK